ncbi:hypothetical protein QBC41DRAFT_340083 [Cercophora samala]|uniref:Secreted protein n=1 Tax=Cercophora samala TaxID=330535 RepID=A0AA39Z5L1_9PEZI|nr:hypothetical protein QBC41DRAFT_340083 [Cercophora samala]
MVSFTSILTTAVVVLSSVASAEYVAVIESVSQNHPGGQFAICQPQAPVYEIHTFSSHPGPVGSSCSWKGKQVAFSRNKIGCRGGYNNGWTVCETSYGANVHNGKGKHQRCDRDNAVLKFCTDGLCWHKMRRVLKCQGVWHKDA